MAAEHWLDALETVLAAEHVKLLRGAGVDAALAVYRNEAGRFA